MALAKCKECGKEVSTSAKTCPHCGVKNPGVRAKDMIIGVLTLLLIGWLVTQCTSGNESDQSELNLTMPNGLSGEVKSLVESGWPKIKAACPGLKTYADNLEFREIYDNFSSASSKEAERVSIVFKVKESSSLVVGGHVASGHNCFFEISRDGTRLSIPKRPCASLCEDRAIENSEYKKSI